jgi:hypothetical protein
MDPASTMKPTPNQATLSSRTTNWVERVDAVTQGDKRVQPWKNWVGSSVDTGFEDGEKEDIILALKNNVQHNNVAA